MLKIVIGALLVAFFVSHSPPALAESRKDYAMRMGGYYKERGDNKRAMDYYIMAVQAAPRDCLIYKELAGMLAGQKKYAEALVQVNKAIELCPTNYKLYSERGLYQLGLGHKDRAEQDFKKAVTETNCGHAVYKNLADLYKEQGRYKDAVAICDLHLKREANETTYRDKSIFLDLNKEHEAARLALGKAIDLAPLNFLNYELRADSFMQSGMAQEAVKDYTKALSLEPYYQAEIHQKRARAYDKLGKKDLADKDRQEARTKD